MAPWLVGRALANVEMPSSEQPWSVVGDLGSDGVARLAVGGMGEGTLTVEWSTVLGRKLSGRSVGDKATAATDFTAQATLKNLPSDSEVLYKARVGDKTVYGRFKTAPSSTDTPVRLVWGGDVVGQGWGIDPARGGMLTFASMLKENPHFFLHSGDTIYADVPVSALKEMDNGETWHNLTIPEKLSPATTLKDFHGNYRYNFLDEHYRKFFAQVPVIVQWDDHEVKNNWSPAEHADLADPGRQAFRNYWPIRDGRSEPLYRKLSFGPLVDVFVLDLRAHRAPNSDNDQSEAGAETVMLGPEQSAWFKEAMAESRAVWKIVGGEMPLATYTPEWGLDSWANGKAEVLGREHELADILSFFKRKKIENVVWLSADVHYAMAIEYLPEKAAFKDFQPFWEFIAGPLHAGTFSPQGDLDPTFGPVEHFCAVPRDLPPNRPPSDDLQFYGKIEASLDQLAVSLHQRQGKEIYEVVIPAS